VNKLIRFILSSKRNMIICGILLLVAASVAFYTVLSISSNLKQMAADATEAKPYYPDYPAVNTQGKDAALIQRGEYLTKAGDCIACHTNTPKKGAVFAGGLPMHTPFGTIYSPNITSDKETGIGKWTEAQFITAMTKGISPQGHYYYPAFPYYYFSNLTHDDLVAIKAYLDSIPVVHQENRKNEMMMPFNIRFLQLGWRELFFRSQEELGTYKPDSKKTTEWNRGAYLVEGLGHCAMCHSPSYHILTQSLPLAAPIKKYHLTGAPIQGYLAPNISQSNLGAISNEEIIKVFTEDRLIGGGKVEGPMLEANRDSLHYLTHEDLGAIATYLKSVQSTTPPKPKSSGGPGAGIYEGYCAGCHAMGSGGAPKFGDAAAWDTLLKTKVDDVYNNAIHGIGGMPAKGTCITCSDTDIKQAVDYMILAAKGETGTVTVVKAPKAKELTIADGKRVYEKDCAVCHNTGFKGAPKPGDTKAWEPILDKDFFEIYQNVMSGKHGHLAHGACPDCSDEQIKAAIKYMLQSSTTEKDYELW
jgi:cytochrome c5